MLRIPKGSSETFWVCSPYPRRITILSWHYGRTSSSMRQRPASSAYTLIVNRCPGGVTRGGGGFMWRTMLHAMVVARGYIPSFYVAGADSCIWRVGQPNRSCGRSAIRPRSPTVTKDGCFAPLRQSYPWEHAKLEKLGLSALHAAGTLWREIAIRLQ